MPEMPSWLAEVVSDVAANFLQKSVPLNESISKVAEAKSLNPHQIIKLCQEANKAVSIALFSKGDDDKTYEFPLADYKQVLAGLNSDIPDLISKVASERDVDPTPDDEHVQMPAPKGRVGRKTAPIRQLRAEMAQMENAASELTSRVKEAEAALLKSASQFVDRVQQIHLDQNAGLNSIAEDLAVERPAYIPVINSLMKTASKKLREPYTLMPCDMVKQGAAVTELLASNTQSMSTPSGDGNPASFLTFGNAAPVRVINGDQELIKVLDTTIEQAHHRDKNLRGLIWVRDQVKYITLETLGRLSDERQKEI